MLSRKGFLGAAGAALLALGMFASPAKAESILVTLVSKTLPDNSPANVAGPAGTLYSYTYQVNLDIGNQVQSNVVVSLGDGFTMYDFQTDAAHLAADLAALNSGPLSANWLFTSSNVGGYVNPGGRPMPGEDQGDRPNITATYIGTTPIVFDDEAQANQPNNQLALFTFTVHSTVFLTALDAYAAQDHSSSTPVAGPSFNSGLVRVPSDPNGPTITPLPTSALAGTGLFGLLALAKFRRRSSVAA